MQNFLFVGQDYAMHILIPKNTKSGEPKIKNIGDKFQDNNELIIQNMLELPIPGEPKNRTNPLRGSRIQFPSTRIIPFRGFGI